MFVSTVLLVLPALFLGWEMNGLFWERVLVGARQVQSFASTGGGQAIWPVLYRFFIDGAHVGLVGDAPLLFRLPLFAVQCLWAFFVIVVLLQSKRTYVRLSKRSLQLVLMLCTLSLLLSPGWHHYFAFLPFALALLWREVQSTIDRFLIVISLLLQTIPILGLGLWSNIYGYYSLFGGTFWATFFLWLALVRHLRDTVEGGGSQVSRES